MNQRGITLVDALAVVALVAIVSSIAGVYGVDLMRAEQMRGATYEIFIQMNVARVESINRNRSCRLIVDTGNRTVRVLDLQDEGNPDDDEEIVSTTLSPGVRFELPGGGAAVTLNPLGGALFETTFASDGTVTTGSGAVAVGNGEIFRRISVFAGGAVAVERWNGSAWVVG